MKRCAVIGDPIAHSLSPLLHRAAYEAAGIADEFSYDAIEVTPKDLSRFVRKLGSEWAGLSVTAPHKEAILAFGHPDPIAAGLRAANTVIFGEHEPRLFNTDVTGLAGALARIGVQEAETLTLLGNGATARSALYAATGIGVGHILVACRDERRARSSLADLAAERGATLSFTPITNPKLRECDLLISTVPTRLAEALAARYAQSARAVLDVVYAFHPSPIETAAAHLGVPTASGYDMLIEQALEQITLMTGRRVGPQPLRQALERSLRA